MELLQQPVLKKPTHSCYNDCNMKITTLKRKFPNEWVLAEVLKEDELHQVLEVKPLVHSKNRDEVYDGLLNLKKGQHVMTLYTGKPLKDMAYLL